MSVRRNTSNQGAQPTVVGVERVSAALRFLLIQAICRRFTGKRLRQSRCERRRKREKDATRLNKHPAASRPSIRVPEIGTKKAKAGQARLRAHLDPSHFATLPQIRNCARIIESFFIRRGARLQLLHLWLRYDPLPVSRARQTR